MARITKALSLLPPGLALNPLSNHPEKKRRTPWLDPANNGAKTFLHFIGVREPRSSRSAYDAIICASRQNHDARRSP